MLLYVSPSYVEYNFPTFITAWRYLLIAACDSRLLSGRLRKKVWFGFAMRVSGLFISTGLTTIYAPELWALAGLIIPTVVTNAHSGLVQGMRAQFAPLKSSRAFS